MNKTYEEWLQYYENATKEQVVEDMYRDIQEIKQLKDNWNKLKNIAKSQSDFKQKLGNDRVYFEIDELLEKMQELENGDSNE